MTQLPDAPTLPPGFRVLGNTFRLIGWLGFWIKSGLAVFSSLIIISAFISSNIGVNTGQSRAVNPASGIGLLLVVGGIILLGISAFWSFRYARWGRRFLSPAAQPSKAATLRLVKTDLITNLLGMMLTVMGGEAIVGLILLKALSGWGTNILNFDPNRIVNPSDLLVVLAFIHPLAGQFLGLVAALILLQRTTQQRSPTSQ